MKPFSRNNPATPGVPMIYSPPRLDHLYSDEVAARLCREYTQECVERLVDHMRNSRLPAISLAATNSILDRAYGKPKELKMLSGPDGKEARLKIEVEFIDVLDGDALKREHGVKEAPQAPEPLFEE